MHKLLARQLRRYFSNESDKQEYQTFINAVDQAYNQSDQDRELLERSLDLVSKELNEQNRLLSSRLVDLESTHSNLENSLATLSATFDSTGEAIFVLDTPTETIECNATAKELFDLPKDSNRFSTDEVENKLKELLADKTELIIELKKLELHPQETLFFNVNLVNNLTYQVHSSPKLLNGELVGRVWCLRDISEIQKNELLLEHQAFHDTLTNLPNRALLGDRLERALSLSERTNNRVAVLFIDLDKFKKVNDTAGHSVGDELLKEVSQRILKCIREHDTLARLGGDEFVVMLEQVESTRVITLMCQRVFKSLQDPFQIKDVEYFISCSIGVSIAPQDGTESQQLIRKADMAMYHAKEQGRSNFQYFDGSLERLAMHQLSLENKLREAIENNHLEIYYQPKVCLETKSIESMEALLRWNHNGEFISPMEFIPIAEQTGLINQVSQWVLEEVCQHIIDWQNLNIPIPRISINISPIELQNRLLPEALESTLKKYQVPGEMIELEIIESTLLHDVKSVDLLLAQIKKLGITLAIDDFGTGYSSMQYLQKLPLDSLKIDKSFVLDLAKNKQDQAITFSILALGKNLGMQVVAEGVEDEETVQLLVDSGCNIAQGFYFYRPQPKDEVTKILSSQSRPVINRYNQG